MTIRHYYLCSKDAAQGSHSTFRDSHWIDCENGMVLLSAAFPSDQAQAAWEKSGCTCLPLIWDNKPLDASIISQLAAIGARTGDNVQKVQQLARAVHPLM